MMQSAPPGEVGGAKRASRQNPRFHTAAPKFKAAKDHNWPQLTGIMFTRHAHYICSENSFFCFVQNGARFWKCLWDYLVLFRIRQVKAAKNVQQEVFTEKSNGKTGGERGLDDFIMPELEELIFTAVAIVCRDSQFWKCFRDCRALSKWRQWKSFLRNCMQVR